MHFHDFGLATRPVSEDSPLPRTTPTRTTSTAPTAPVATSPPPPPPLPPLPGDVCNLASPAYNEPACRAQATAYVESQAVQAQFEQAREAARQKALADQAAAAAAAAAKAAASTEPDSCPPGWVWMRSGVCLPPGMSSTPLPTPAVRPGAPLTTAHEVTAKQTALDQTAAAYTSPVPASGLAPQGGVGTALAGAGAGFLMGGPVGAAVGGVLGYLAGRKKS